jgi:polygalacturonase
MQALLFLLAWCSLAADLPTSVCDVMRHGAKADGATNDAPAIQQAIDSCAASGGMVFFPAGNYLSGTIVLKSNVTLHLSEGATLWASKRPEDFKPLHLIYAKDAENITLEGDGTINGNGEAYWDTNTKGFFRAKGPRPSPLVELVNCRRVRIRDLAFRNAPGWTIHPLGCDGVWIHGISIVNHTRGPNTDGIDPDSSRNVFISDFYCEAGDDCIVIKTTGWLAGGKVQPAENITVTNSVLTTTCGAFKLGTESLGDFRNIAFTNSTMFRIPGAFQSPISGIAIDIVDGSTLDGLVVSNVIMRDVRTPIFIRLGNRGRGMKVPVPGILRNVSISNVLATGAELPSSITGLPGYPVENLTLANVNITMKGGGHAVRGLDVPENPEKYPDPAMFGPLPAYGFYVRHAAGLALKDVQVRWDQEDARPAMIFDDVRDLDLDGFRAGKAAGEQPVVWFNQVAGALVRGCRAPAGAQRFLRVSGAGTGNVRLWGNDLTGAAQPLDRAPEVPATAITQ